MSYDARAVANYFLDLAEARRLRLSALSLQKLIFFGHGWHLAIHNRPLIKNRIEAWPNGPVVPIVYDAFKHCDALHLVGRAKKFDPAKNCWLEIEISFEKESADIMSNVFQSYSRYHAFALSEMTHEKNSPWDVVWNEPGQKVHIGMSISDDSIRRFFHEKVRRIVSS